MVFHPYQMVLCQSTIGQYLVMRRPSLKEGEPLRGGGLRLLLRLSLSEEEWRLAGEGERFLESVGREGERLREDGDLLSKGDLDLDRLLLGEGEYLLLKPGEGDLLFRGDLDLDRLLGGECEGDLEYDD